MSLAAEALSDSAHGLDFKGAFLFTVFSPALKVSGNNMLTVDGRKVAELCLCDDNKKRCIGSVGVRPAYLDSSALMMKAESRPLAPAAALS